MHVFMYTSFVLINPPPFVVLRPARPECLGLTFCGFLETHAEHIVFLAQVFELGDLGLTPQPPLRSDR